MKIFLLGGSSSGTLDEGMQNITRRLGAELSRRHAVRIVPLRVSSLPGLRRSCAEEHPDILHYTSGPSILSLFLLKAAAAWAPGCKTVVSALHPWFPLGSGGLVRAVRPDLVLTQSRKTDAFFRGRGCRTAPLSNGVDVARFAPALPAEKKSLRAEFELPSDAYILLHVGAVKARRGVGRLAALQRGDRQVLVVGSVSTGYDAPVLRLLEAQGCRVWRTFIPQIEKIYRLADCYVFPARDPLHAIETPLSVLEAMAANLPVVTTRFGALADSFSEGEGLVFADTPEEFEEGIRRIREARYPVRTREKVSGNAWEVILGRLEEQYRAVRGEQTA